MIHALTLNWNAGDKLDKLASGLFKQTVKVNWHIKDNGSVDKSADGVRDSSTVYDIGHNRDNFAQGVNYLFEKVNPSDDDLILLLNNDVQFRDTESLERMVELQKKTGADIVGARLLFTDTNKLQHAGVIFSNRYGQMPYHFRPSEESDESAERNRYFQAVTAAVSLVTASSFRKVGGMNPKYHWAFEDIDMCLKIGALKKNNIAYCGGTQISHEESASLKKNPVNKMMMGPNVQLFKNTWFGKYEIDHDRYLNDKSYKEIRL